MAGEMTGAGQVGEDAEEWTNEKEHVNKTDEM